MMHKILPEEKPSCVPWRFLHAPSVKGLLHRPNARNCSPQYFFSLLGSYKKEGTVPLAGITLRLKTFEVASESEFQVLLSSFIAGDSCMQVSDQFQTGSP